MASDLDIWLIVPLLNGMSKSNTTNSVDINTVPLSEILEHVNAREFSILNKYYVAGGTEKWYESTDLKVLIA